MISRHAGVNLKRWASGCAVLWLYAAAALAQSTILPPECKGKTGAQLDQCVRDVTQPATFDGAEPFTEKVDPRRLLNCLKIYRADESFCIARNEIILECRNYTKHPDFDACATRLITRPQLPRAADCTRAAPAERNRCVLRNKVFGECLANPWLYFECLGEKTNK